MSKQTTTIVPILVCAVAGVALGWVLINDSQVWVGKAPHVEPPILNFGTVIEGRRVTGAVRVVNPGDTPLYVSQVVTSCGCTSVGKIDAIPAHGSATLAVAFDSTGRPGTIAKHISVFTTESPDAPIEFALGGTVKTEWRVSPSAALDLGVITGGDTKTATVRVSHASGKSVVLAASPKTGDTSASITNGDAATVRVSVTAPRLPGAR